MFLKICPWGKMENVALGMGYWYNKSVINPKGTEFIVSSIKREDQEQIRRLFQDAYSEFSKEYPSIKKWLRQHSKLI